MSRAINGCMVLVMWLLFSTVDGLTINLFSMRNGKGLETDEKVLKEAIERDGHQVQSFQHSHATNHKHDADVNIFIEMINPEMLSWAPRNWFIPNPEWYRQELALLDRVDLILCRTEEVEKIFKGMGKKTYYLGFTSPDCLQEGVEKDYTKVLHLAGGSNLKGTPVVLKVWSQRDDMPSLTVVKHNQKPEFAPLSSVMWIGQPLPQVTLRELQNSCGLHLCPSETEGFGHYIMEAMSAGAVVITTDAPPMNRLITDPRCLIPCRNTSSLRLATAYHVDPKLLELKMKLVAGLPIADLKAIGAKNRATYLQQRDEFHHRLHTLLKVES